MSDRLDASAVQNQVAQILQKEILPLLDRYFSTFSLPDNTDQIDRLVLDLGMIRLNELEADFIEKIAQNLLEQLPGLCNDSPNLQLIAPEVNTSGRSVTGIESQRGNVSSVVDKPLFDEKLLFNGETIEFGTENPQVFSSDQVNSAGQPVETDDFMNETDSSVTEKNGIPNVSENGDSELEHSENVPVNQKEISQADLSGIPVSEAALSEEEAKFQHKQLQSYSTQRQLDLLSYFLQTGLFPWWVSKSGYELLENTVDQLLLRQPVLLSITLIRWTEFAAVRKRIAATFSDQILIRIVQLIATDPTAEPILQKVLELLDRPFFSSAMRSLFLEEWLKTVYLRQKGVFYRPESLLHRLAELPFTGVKDKTVVPNPLLNEEQFFLQHRSELVRLLLQLFGLPDQSTFPDELLNLQKSDSLTPGSTVIEESEGHFPDALEEATEDGFEGNPEALKSNPDQTSGFGSHPVREKELPLEPEVDEFSKSDKIYLNNAGLVLLWPFLQRFFENTGLYNEEGFVDADAAERAVWLLQYIVLGEDAELFEPQLPLNKVLTGLKPETPVSRPTPISAEESEMIRGLLEAVTGYVPTWKNLSMEGFRQAYLQREGALSARDGQWLLQVKRETYDILLEKVPWSWQIVRLPWMNQILVVEW